MSKRFEGKVVLVTGGNRNTGLWLVKRFVDDGARVFMCGSSEESTLRGADALSYARAEAAAFAPPRDLPATAPSDFLRAARGAEVRLDGFELSPAGVLAEGSAPSPDARAAFLDALRSAGFAVVAEDRPSKDGRAAFALKPPAAP